MLVQPHLPIRLASTVARVESSAIRDLLTITERPDVLSLAGGLPAPEAFPAAVIAEEVARLLAGDPGVLQYSTTEGYEPLRAWAGRRVGAGADAVVVTHGSQQGLDLLARVALEPGDVVALADPGYVGAIQALRLAGGSLMAVPSDSDGMQVDVLADRLAAGARLRLVYVVANFSNPSGATLALDRRVELARLADRYGFLIVEDDPYGELRWAGTAWPAISTLTDRVVSLGTVSKTVCPGMRVGFVVAPPEVRDALVLVKQAVDLHTATLAQRTVHAVVTRPGFLAAHLARLRPLYEERAAALVDGLEAELGGAIELTRPQGGMFVWARLPGVDTEALLPAAIDAGVAYVPGRAFGIDDPHTDELRLSFATSAPGELREGARRLAAALATRR